MEHNDLFIFDTEEVDVKEMMKIRIPMIQNDTPILKFRVYNYGEPVDLSEYHLEFRCFLVNGELYSEEDNLSVDGNEITIRCDKTVTQAVGENIGSLRIWDKTYKQKSTYQIILRVKSVSGYDESHEVSHSTISVLERLDEAICRAIDLKIELNESITLAEDINEKLKQTIIEANKSRDDLQSVINSSNNANEKLEETIKKSEDADTKLNTSIANAQNEKTSLDEKIELAESTKSNLDSSIAESVTKKNDLNEEITKANEKITELKNFDTDGIIEKTNELYKEIYPDKDLVTINHGLNCYPLVQFITTSDGYGKGQYGNTIYGGSFSCNLGTYETVYVDKNTLKLIVSENANLPNPVLNKISDVEYSVTSYSTENSMNIKLIDSDGFNKLQNMKYEDAGGNATNIELTLQEPLTNGYFKKFIGKENSNNQSITINGKYPLYKPCTTTPPNIKTGKPYEIYYNESNNCFFLKASAEGDAIAENVLAGKYFSNGDDTGLLGTMPNNGDFSRTLGLNETINLPNGYYNSIKINQNLTTHGASTDCINTCIGADGEFYVRIPLGAYFTKSWEGHPEIKVLTSDVTNTLKTLPGTKKDEIVKNLGAVRQKTLRLVKQISLPNIYAKSKIIPGVYNNYICILGNNKTYMINTNDCSYVEFEYTTSSQKSIYSDLLSSNYVFYLGNDGVFVCENWQYNFQLTDKSLKIANDYSSKWQISLFDNREYSIKYNNQLMVRYGSAYSQYTLPTKIGSNNETIKEWIDNSLWGNLIFVKNSDGDLYSYDYTNGNYYYLNQASDGGRYYFAYDKSDDSLLTAYTCWQNGSQTYYRSGVKKIYKNGNTSSILNDGSKSDAIGLIATFGTNTPVNLLNSHGCKFTEENGNLISVISENVPYISYGQYNTSVGVNNKIIILNKDKKMVYIYELV